MRKTEIDQGYVRVKDNRRHDDAVQWWYSWRYDDGWSFARGGRCRTIREARHLLRSCYHEMQSERTAFEGRPTHTFNEDYEVVPLPRSPYESVR